MASYDFDYAIESLRQAIDFAEIERDFVPLRKWTNEVEASGHELGAMEDRLNLPAGQEVLMAIMQSVATGSATPDAALLRIRHWLNSGQAQEMEAELTQQYQFA
jgi:hypothetical protein